MSRYDFQVLILILATSSLLGQISPELSGTLVRGFGDVGKLKLQAEAGEIQAQIKLADALLSNFKAADALKWYLAAATNKSAQAQSQAGELLLFGRTGIPKEQSVVARPEEGLRLTYLAAIGGKKNAWRNMAKALKGGVGCSIDTTQAFAWLTLLAEEGDIVGRVEMNNLAEKLSATDIVRGKSLAAQMKSGNWPACPSIRLAVNFKVSGVMISPTKKLATINNRTFQEGETAQIKDGNRVVNFTCTKITPDSVAILVEGENEPRTVKIEKNRQL